MAANRSSALLDRLWPQVSDDLLQHIASRPWVGDADKHHAELRAFRERGLPDDASDWTVHPSEALEIVRWSRPDDPKRKGRLPVDEAHLARLFSCAVLIHAEGHGLWHQNPEATRAHLLESARFFSPEYEAGAQSMLAWLDSVEAVVDDG